jgi:hypothetical protein
MPGFAVASERVVEWAYSCSNPWQKFQHKSQTCFPLELTQSVSCSAVSLKAAGSYLACRHLHCHGYDVLVWEHHNHSNAAILHYFWASMLTAGGVIICTLQILKKTIYLTSLYPLSISSAPGCAVAYKTLVGEWSCYQNNFSWQKASHKSR